VVLNSFLMFPLRLNGLALATSIAGIGNFLILFTLLNKKIGGFDIRGLSGFVLKVLLASLAMGAVCSAALRVRLCLGFPGTERILRLAIPMAAGMVTYVFLCFALRIEQAARFVTWLKTRKI